MRLLTLFVFASLALAQSARIEGSVVNASAQPIAGAQITLERGATSFKATSGDDGTFTIEGIPPARNYQLTAQGTGLAHFRYQARTPSTGTPTALEAGQVLSGVTITMRPQAVIGGRITDEAGSPAQNVQVRVLWRDTRNGRLFPVGSTRTNTQGEYTVPNLPPGRYFVLAEGHLFYPRPTVTPAEPVFLLTYFPSAVDHGAAAALDLEEGAELRAVDIRMRRTQLHSVRGKLVGLDGSTVTRAALIARPQGGGFLPTSSFALVRDGSFEIASLSAGTYFLEVPPATAVNGEHNEFFGRMEVTIADADINGIVFALTRGKTITGTVRLENGDPPPLASTPSGALRVTLTDANGVGNASSRGEVRQDGTFVVENAPPGISLVGVSLLPAGFYIKSIRFNGADVTESGLDLSQANGPLDILLSSNARGAPDVQVIPPPK